MVGARGRRKGLGGGVVLVVFVGALDFRSGGDGGVGVRGGGGAVVVAVLLVVVMVVVLVLALVLLVVV